MSTERQIEDLLDRLILSSRLVERLHRLGAQSQTTGTDAARENHSVVIRSTQEGVIDATGTFRLYSATTVDSGKL